MKKIGQVKIDLKDIITAPIHYDFKIQSFNNAGRLYFDIKMSQIVEIKISFKEVICEMKDSLNSNNYYYSLNILNINGKTESAMSKPFENIFLNLGFEGQANIYAENDQIRKNLEKKEFQIKSGSLKQSKDNLDKNNDKRKKFKTSFKFSNFRDVDSNNEPNLHIKQNQSDTTSNYENKNILDTSNSKSLVSFSGFAEKEEDKKQKEIEFPETIKKKNPKVINDFPNTTVLKKYTTLKKNADEHKMDEKMVKTSLKWTELGPEITCQINVSELSSSNLQICIWKERKILNKLFLKSECYLYMQKFLNYENEEIQQENNYIKKDVIFSNKLWLGGINTGIIKAKFEMKYIKFFEQKVAGVLTENGIIKSAPLIYQRKSKNHPKLVFFNTSYNELVDLIHKKDNSKNLDMKTYYQDLLKAEVIEMKKVFLDSDKSSSKSFIYASLKEINKAQDIFLEIASLLLDSYKNTENYMEESFYSCLKAILYRGELALSSLAFNSENKNDELKIKVGLKYQALIYRLLGFVLDCIHQKGLNDSERNFIETFLAYAYFRIPEFRKELISCLNNKVEYEETPEQNAVYSILLNWQEDFFNYISKHDSSNKAKLVEILKKPWRGKFENLSYVYFYFIIEWVNYVQKTLVIDKFNWALIPGYNVLVQNFMNEMKKLDLKKYPEILIDASLALLKNSKILNDFIQLLISRTNLFLQNNVVILFDILSKFFGHFRIKKRNLPLNLDFHLLIYITILMLKTNHALAISHSLNFWYINFNLVPDQVKINMFEIIVEYYFFKLFLHWSSNVREVFYFFIFYGVIRVRNNLKNENLAHLDAILRRINKFICLIKFIGDEFKKKIFVWEMLPKNEKKKSSYEEIQKNLIHLVNSKKIYQKFKIVNKLKILSFELDKKDDSFDFNHAFIDFNMSDNIKKKIQKNDFFVFAKNKFTSLKIKNLVYCSTVFKKFEEIRNKFYSTYKEIIDDDFQMPLLKFQLPIDQFEYVDEEDDVNMW